jgi:UPF0176 protein
MPRVLIAALYKFVALDDYTELQAPLLARAKEAGIRGSLLIAKEGINGTIAGEEPSLRAFLDYLRSDPRLADLVHKESWTDEMPFLRMKVRKKKEIVTIGLPEVDPTKLVGTYVKPKDWNALISDPNVVLVDTRNDYEVEIGTFQGAIDPNTTSFGEFPEWTQTAPELQGKTKVAMFCTGGIRCEKASSYMLSQGVEEVFHLEGGILKYLEEIPKDESMWEGECFVFDERVAVDHDLKPGKYTMCFGCRRPVSPEMKQDPKYMEGVCCPHCHDEISDDQRARFAERHHQIQLASERGEVHRGRDPKAAGQTAQTLKQRHSDKPVLYSFRRCPYAMRARMALLSAGIEIELREVVLRDKPSHMLKLSPKGSVPVLWLSDGRVIDESLDVMLWALRQSDPNDWLPADETQLSEALELVKRNDDEFKYHLDRYKYPSRYDGAVGEEHRSAAESFLATLEAQLRETQYLHGSQRSFLDAAILPFIRQFANTDRTWFDQAPYPALQAWMSKELEAPSFTGMMQKYPQWQPGFPGADFPPELD